MTTIKFAIITSRLENSYNKIDKNSKNEDSCIDNKNII